MPPRTTEPTMAKQTDAQGAYRGPALAARNLSKDYRVRTRGKGRTLHAVHDVSLEIGAGSTLGVVGESGCGKSTLARLLVGLEPPTSGSIEIGGVDLAGLRGGERREVLRNVQMVFQSPYTSLDPRMTTVQTIREPLDVWSKGRSRRQRTEAALELMAKVGLDRALADRYPNELSGGQQQRVGMARALAAGSEIVICDEPVSALDVSIQAQVLNLLRDLQRNLGLTYVFIAHNLTVVATVSDFIAVMYLGRIVEYGRRDDVFTRPMHPYTKALLSSAPIPDPEIEAARRPVVLHGDLPSPYDRPSGCPFRTRCPSARDVCAEQPPPVVTRDGGAHQAVCFFPDDLSQ